MNRSTEQRQDNSSQSTFPRPNLPNETQSQDTSSKAQNFGHYKILGKLGEGGMGVVFAALDTRLIRRVAIKFMQEKLVSHPTARERFLREARNAAQIKDDHVVTIYETNEIDNIPYFAMEFLEGVSLEEYLKRNANPTIPQILRIGIEIATGLAQAHRLGVIHRDIKPANLWLEAPHGRIKILDFGLAKLVDEDINLSQQGVIIGTPAYMSPEQATHQILDARSDLFSLGAVLYRLCVSQLPFFGQTVPDVLRAIENDPITPLRELKPDIPENLGILVQQLLEKNPENRPQRAEEVIKQLLAITKEIGATAEGANTYIQLEEFLPAPVPMLQQNRETQEIGKNVTLLQKEPKQGLSSFWMLIGGGTFVAILVLSLILLNKKADPEPVVNEPNLPTEPKPDSNPEKKDPITTKTVTPAIDPYHRAAEYILSVDGYATIEVDGRSTKLSSPLPIEPFTFKMVNLKTNRKVRDSGFAVFAGCHKISTLYLDNTSIGDEGLKFFDGIDSVGELSLRGTNATIVGLGYFKKCQNLTDLILDSTRVTDQGFDVIAQFAKLTSLNLVSTSISDQSIPHLMTLKKLRVLHLKGTLITEQGVKNLKAVLPNCNISK